MTSLIDLLRQGLVIAKRGLPFRFFAKLLLLLFRRHGKVLFAVFRLPVPGSLLIRRGRGFGAQCAV